mgnify:FL=1
MDSRFPRKLTLNRETVRELSTGEMERVEGGDKKPYTAGKGCIPLTNTIYPCVYCV